MDAHIGNLLQLHEFMPTHLVSIMLYSFVSGIISFFFGELIETFFRRDALHSEESSNRGFFEISTLYLTISTLLQCLAISISVFLIHKITSLVFLLVGLNKTAYIGISHSRATFAASNVVIVMVLVHTIKTFNSHLSTVLNRLKKI